MKVQALKQFQGAEGMVRPRQVLDVDEKRAGVLIGKGLVEPYAGSAAPGNKMMPASRPGPSAASPDQAPSAVNPMSASQLGGRTGEAKPASSSRPVRQRKK